MDSERHSRLLELLACPRCGAELAFRTDGAIDPRSGVFVCQGCQTGYRSSDDVPRFNEALEENRLTGVAETFGFEWKAHHEGEFESDTLFGRTRQEDWAMVTAGMRITDADVKGAVVLDAGCGSGRFCQLFAEHGAKTVVGIDIHDAVDEAARHCRSYENVHIVQANVFALPFKRGAFDLVWCNGVIHHTPDAIGAHRSLAAHVRPGGILYVWVYAARFNPFRLVKTALRGARLHRWPPRAVQALAAAMAYVSLGILALYQLIRSLPGLRPSSAWGRRTVRRRTIEELKLTWFDALSPEFDSRHTEEEAVGWFRDQGYSEIWALEEPKVGVRGVAPPLA